MIGLNGVIASVHSEFLLLPLFPEWNPSVELDWFRPQVIYHLCELIRFGEATTTEEIISQTEEILADGATSRLYDG